MSAILKGAEPFEFEGNDIGVLVIHGFTGSTQSMRYLGEELNKQYGFTTIGPRLPGHGTSPDDMASTCYMDWLGEAEAQLKSLAKRKKNIFVAGLSMGGSITLNLAGRFGNLIQGIAPVAAAAGILSDDFADALFLNPRPERLPGVGSDIKDPDVTELAYTEIPTTCMTDLTALVMGTTNLLPRITCPALIFQGLDDHVVPKANATLIATSLSSSDVRLVWLENSYHVATLDYDKDLIVKRMGDFFTELAID